MATRDLLRARLALRIYVVGLAQIAVVVAGFIAVIELNRRTGQNPGRQLHLFIGGVMAARSMIRPRARGSSRARAKS